MAREITVSSTTDTQEAVNAAASYGLKTSSAVVEQPEVDNEPQTSEADEAEIVDRREPDTEEEQSPDEEPSEETEEEEPPETAGTPEQPVSKSRRKLLRRLSRMHGENLSLKEKLEQTEERVRRLEAGEKPAQERPAGLVKPNSNDFKNDDEYAEALADYKIALRDQAAAQRAQEDYRKTVAADYERQVQQARQTYDDFEQVVGTDEPVPDLAIEVMKYELENGADVAYYLAKHPEVRDELLEYNQPGFRGGRVKIAAKLQQISEALSSPSRNGSTRAAAPRPRPSTSAPAPIRPVGTASARSTADPGEMSMPDYKKWFKQHYPNAR